jgi:DNA polymerase III subunit delta
MIFFFYGVEDFLTKKKALEIRENFVEKNPSAKVEVFDFESAGQSVEFSEMLSSGGGLFSSKKMVMAKNAFLQDVDFQNKIAEMVSRAKEDKETLVVFVDGEVKTKKSKLFKFLQKNAKVEESKKMDPKKLALWINAQIAEKSQGKITINLAAQARLAQISKNNLWKINSDIEKLVSYKANSGTITLEEVNLLCQGEIEAKIFDLVDAVGNKNKPRAMLLLKSLSDQGENGFYIFSMIIYQLRNLASVANLRDKFGPNHQLVSQETGIHPFVAKKTLDQLRNFSKKKIKSLFALASKIDSDVKSGKLESIDGALAYFIANS